VEDLGSTNGIYVNGARVKQAIIRDGDRVGVGGCVFVVRVRDSEASAPPAASEVWADAGRPGETAGASQVVASWPTSSSRGQDDARPGSGSAGLGPQIVNDSAFRVSTTRWAWTRGSAGLTVIVKATFTIGEPPAVATEQLPMFPADVAGETPGAVCFESDVAPFKPRTDVVVVGHAYAPRGEAATHVLADVSVGGYRFVMAVIGDRVWQWPAGGTPVISPATPFTRMSLDYDRSFGGIDTVTGTYCPENLVGTGIIGARVRQRIHGLKLPNLEDPKNLIRAWDSRPKPVGFGFYGKGWMPRLQFARALGEAYRTGEVDGSLPMRFFNGAHPDLQIDGYIRGDEEIELVNLCPRASRVRFRLPGIVPRVRVARWRVPPETWTADDGEAGSSLVEETVTPALDTLVFMPDENIFYEVFRAVCRLASTESLEIGRITVSV
jgi:hypothetical protein